MSTQDGIGYLRATYNPNLHFTENSDAYANLLYPYIQDNGGNNQNTSLSIDVINANQNFTTKNDYKQQEWIDYDDNGGNLLLDQLIWGFKETTHNVRNSKALSSAFCFNNQSITIKVTKQGHLQGYLDQDFLYCKNTVELSVVDVVRGEETVLTTFKGLELDEDDESRVLEWVIPSESNSAYSNYGFFGLFVFKIKVTSKYYIDATRNVKSKYPDRVTNSYLQLLTYSPAQEAVNVQSNSIDIFETTPVSTDSLLELYEKSVFATLDNYNQNPLSDDQKRAIIADQISVLFISQHPVVSSDLSPSKIQGFGGEKAIQTQKNVKKVITYAERYDSEIIKLAQNRLFGMLANYRSFSFADELNELFDTNDQSTQTIVESPRIIYLNEFGNLSDDIGVEGILFTPYSIENLHTEILSNVPPADPYSIPLYKYSVGIDTLVITDNDDNELDCGDTDIKLSFNIVFGNEKINEIYYQVWINNNSSYNEYLDKSGDTRDHSFDFSPIGGLSCSASVGDILTARVTVLDIYGFSNVFERKLFYPLNQAKPAIIEITSFQREDGSGLIDVYYYYQGVSEINPANVSLTYSINNTSFSSITTNVIGDIGLGIMPGYRKITWNPTGTLTSTNDIAFMKISITDVDESTNMGITESSVVIVDLSIPEIAIRKLSIKEDELMAESSSLSDSSDSSFSSESSESSGGFSSESSSSQSESSSSSLGFTSESSSSSLGFSESSSSSSEGFSESSSSSSLGFSESSSSENYSESSSSSSYFDNCIEAKVVASDAQENDRFGSSVSISGNYSIVGAYHEDGVGSNRGAVYIYRRTGTNTWGEEFKIVASDAEDLDNFGRSVSINGDYAIVGADQEDGAGVAPGAQRGAAYVYRKTGLNTWGEEFKITASDTADLDRFGFSVAINGDYAIVGSYASNTDKGAAYIYRRTGLNTWGEETIIVASDGAVGDQFGWSVSIDGDYAIVGADQEDGTGFLFGAAYIYNRTGLNTWDAGVKIVAPDAADGDIFGWSVSIDGDYAIVGADQKNVFRGAAYIYNRTGLNTWDAGVKIVAPDAADNDFFGRSVSINGDYAIVGADQNNSVYVFERASLNTWSFVKQIVASDAQIGDDFGRSVAIDESYSIVGAYKTGNDVGSAYIYFCDDMNSESSSSFGYSESSSSSSEGYSESSSTSSEGYSESSSSSSGEYSESSSSSSFLDNLIPFSFLSTMSFTPDAFDPEIVTVGTVNWVLGDGNEEVGDSISHIYTIAGTKNVTLEVEDPIDVSEIRVSSDDVQSIDISPYTSLEFLFCEDNNLFTIDVSANIALINFQCNNNNLSSLDVSTNTALTSLACQHNNLPTLDVSTNTALTSLVCNDNSLTTLNVSANTSLTQLLVYRNGITSIDISSNTSLTNFICNENSLSTINVSSNTALSNFQCRDCNLTSLNLLSNTNLFRLECADNPLTTLNISANTSLTIIDCHNCNLSSFDVSSNTLVTSLWAPDNSLIQSEVNQILIDLDSHGLSSGLCNLLNNSAPTGAGLTAKSNLQGKGWTVLTD